jgi:hypothetical protein
MDGAVGLKWGIGARWRRWQTLGNLQGHVGRRSSRARALIVASAGRVAASPTSHKTRSAPMMDIVPMSIDVCALNEYLVS